MSMQDQTEFAKMLAQFKNRGQGQSMINGPIDALMGSAFPQTYNAAAQALGYQQPPTQSPPPMAPQGAQPGAQPGASGNDPTAAMSQMLGGDPTQASPSPPAPTGPDPQMTGQPGQSGTMDNIAALMGRDPQKIQAIMQAGASCCGGPG